MDKLAMCQLKKSLDGLKQAPRAWNSKIRHWLRKMWFAASKSDSSLFIWKGLEGPICILLYVEDFVVTGLAEIGEVKSQLQDAFEMKDLGELHYFLGI